MTQTSIAEAPLTADDRCDKCGAAARIRAVLVSGELLFCGHHAKLFRDALEDKVIALHDPERILKYANV